MCWHCRVVVVVLVVMAGVDKIFAVFFDGVLLSQKHGLLLASVTDFGNVLEIHKRT